MSMFGKGAQGIIPGVCEEQTNAGAIALVLITISALVYRYLQIHSIRKENGECKHQQSTSTSTAPVKAPAGYLETIRTMSSPNAPFFLLDMRLKTGSQFFRVNLPMPGGLYIVSNPDAAKEILKDATSDKPLSAYKTFDSVAGGPGMFTRSTHDKLWTLVRKTTAHSFSSSQVRRMNRICTEHVEMWLADRVQSKVEKLGSFVFDPTEEMAQLTFSSIMESSFEYTSNEEDFDFFTRNCEVAMAENLKESNPFRKLYQRFDSSYYQAVRSRQKVQGFARKVLDAYRDGNDPKRSDATTLIKIISDSNSLTENQKIAEIFLFMLAGFDSTGLSLSAVLVLLAKHPEVQQKLQRELLSMEPDERPKSKYLHYVINESMRHSPIAALGSWRTAGRDFKFQDGDRAEIVIPKNAVVAMPFYVQNRDPALFVEPTLFIPERWETNYEKCRDASTSFSYGARNCPAQSLAKAELYSTIPKILSEYNLELEDEGKLEFLSLLKYVGAKLRATRREPSS